MSNKKKKEKINTGVCGKSKYRSEKEDLEMKKELENRDICLTAKGIMFITLAEALGDRECDFRAKEFDEMWDLFIKRMKLFGVKNLYW